MEKALGVSGPDTILDSQFNSVSQINCEQFSFSMSQVLRGTYLYLKITIHLIVRFNGHSASVFACVCLPNPAIPFREEERGPAHWLLKSRTIHSIDSVDVRNKMQQKIPMEDAPAEGLVRGVGLSPLHKRSHHAAGRDHRSSFKMGERRPRAEAQGHTARSKWRSQDSNLDVTGPEACAPNRVMWSLPPPLSVYVSTVLTLDPGNSHSSRLSASPKRHQCAWSAGRAGRARWQCPQARSRSMSPAWNRFPVILL